MRRRNDPTTVTTVPDPATTADLIAVAQGTTPGTQTSLPNVPMEDRSSIKSPDAAAGPAAPAGTTGYQLPRMPKSYERIVTTVFDMPDPHEEFSRLRQELELNAVKPSNANYGDLVDALDQAEKNAQRAVELVANFNLAHEAFIMDELAISGPLRERAKGALEKEKREEFERAKAELGSKAPGGKQITEADVAAAVASMFPDEARALAQRVAEGKGALLSVKSLADRWAERAKDLRAMVSTTRAASSSSH